MTCENPENPEEKKNVNVHLFSNKFQMDFQSIQNGVRVLDRQTFSLSLGGVKTPAHQIQSHSDDCSEYESTSPPYVLVGEKKQEVTAANCCLMIQPKLYTGCLYTHNIKLCFNTVKSEYSFLLLAKYTFTIKKGTRVGSALDLPVCSIPSA